MSRVLLNFAKDQQLMITEKGGEEMQLCTRLRGCLFGLPVAFQKNKPLKQNKGIGFGCGLR
jgi:hypothetical protein